MKTQHTPNLQEIETQITTNRFLNSFDCYPPAQDPDEEPPFSIHSALVKHVPFRKV